ncbi:(Fe-S)-binding protein [Tepidibacter aestuarii]|uniref:(Fe-S)-binding protein n=1 Tax=Tepidibacter aestuarii TaxID=2925782 RepID=UPI0020BEF068|nr:(Fe-S)-binding protein [Tepidibacter aestuarii]CAH2214088.1 Cysteine-rich domain-containing protein [Tepidibacter aestuarii]
MKKRNVGVKLHQLSSFSKLFTASSGYNEDNVKAFIPGCSLTDYSPQIVMKTYKYLNDNLGNTGIILKCCAAPSKISGDKEGFKSYYSQLQEEIENMKVKEIITACQTCHKTIKENSPGIEVKSIWESINDIGIPDDIKKKYKDLDKVFALHDPCPIRKENSIHENVRDVLSEMGIKIEEFNNSRERTSCCGGKLSIQNKELALNHMRKRANEANSDYILTYCESCVKSMKTAGKNSIHILDLIFNDNINSKFDQMGVNYLQKWMNRYKCKTYIEQLKNTNKGE